MWNIQCSILTYLAVKAMVDFMRALCTECVLAKRLVRAKVDVAEERFRSLEEYYTFMKAITMAIIGLGTAPLWLTITSLCGAAGQSQRQSKHR